MTPDKGMAAIFIHMNNRDLLSQKAKSRINQIAWSCLSETVNVSMAKGTSDQADVQTLVMSVNEHLLLQSIQCVCLHKHLCQQQV